MRQEMKAAIRNLRDMRPRFKVADSAASGRFGRAAMAIAVIGAAAALAVPSGLAGRHDRPVPILMYHVIAAPPAGVAFPELFVRPADFAKQMKWLAHQGFHAVTLREVYEYWLTGSPLPRRAVVISFDDGYLSQATEAMPVLRKLHWPGVLNLKVNAVQKFNLPLWRGGAPARRQGGGRRPPDHPPPPPPPARRPPGGGGLPRPPPPPPKPR